MYRYLLGCCIVIVLLTSFLVCNQIKAQNRVVTQAAQVFVVPEQVDTQRCIMLVTDTTTIVRDGVRRFINSSPFQIKGYMRIGGSHWYPVFLNEYKQLLPVQLIVWNSILVK